MGLVGTLLRWIVGMCIFLLVLLSCVISLRSMRLAFVFFVCRILLRAASLHPCETGWVGSRAHNAENQLLRQIHFVQGRERMRTAEARVPPGGGVSKSCLHHVLHS